MKIIYMKILPVNQKKLHALKKKHKPRIIVSDHMGKYSASISNPSKMSNNPQERQEVESLQDYKSTFPKWKPGSLASHVKNLDENGLDLLSVRNALYIGFNTMDN